ncbi:protein YLS3-like [Phalaenopsis equestris]|uniref:protein YLS3-like n=1 Tax=Phalaenopsis equestris TaxID=78828 RepID=UPI0009E51634|nr:protein YLS3-like [Phalaenopsis equestris]
MGLLPLLLLLLLAGAAKSDFAKDREECANTLAGLATCLTYVQGSSAVPTPDCCAGLKGVLSSSPKCLCVLIKDRDNPSLGVHINLTRALILPETCKASANISHCPELLNLPPNSPDAQVFKNLTAGSTAKGSSAGDKGSGTSNSNESSHGRRLVGVQQQHSFVALLLLPMFFTIT